MANTYYSITPETSTVTIAEIAAALQDKYGAGVTIHYTNADNVIFSCPAVSDKVIRLYSNYGLNCYYGDAWTSGTTITNSVKICGYSVSSSNISLNMVLGPNTIFFSAIRSPISTGGGTVLIIGKLSNDDFAILSALGNTSSYYSSYLSYNTTKSLSLYPKGFQTDFAMADGKLYKQPIILKRADGSVEQNADGTIASFIDVFTVSYQVGLTAEVVAANYVMSASPLWYNGKSTIETSIMAVF